MSELSSTGLDCSAARQSLFYPFFPFFSEVGLTATLMLLPRDRREFSLLALTLSASIMSLRSFEGLS